ncbi:MAG: NADPH-dependent FMN reductase [Gemmatimonadales bacterium]
MSGEVLHLVGFSGSLRAASYNSALLREVVAMLPATVRITVHSIADIPLFNEDVEEQGTPEPVLALHRAIRASDGVVLATPEYNHGIPGVLKNTLDWMSRGTPHAFYGVPTALLGASNGFIGTTRSQAATRQTLAALNSPCLPFPQVLVSRVQDKIDANLRLTDESTRKFIHIWLVEVERWMRRFPRSEREATGA